VLLLKVRPGEKVLVGDRVVVRVVEIHSLGTATIGIEAPPEINIDHRRPKKEGKRR